MTDAWPDPEAALDGFLAKFDPDIAAEARAAMQRLRGRRRRSLSRAVAGATLAVKTSGPMRHGASA